MIQFRTFGRCYLFFHFSMRAVDRILTVGNEDDRIGGVTLYLYLTNLLSTSGQNTSSGSYSLHQSNRAFPHFAGQPLILLRFQFKNFSLEKIQIFKPTYFIKIFNISVYFSSSEKRNDQLLSLFSKLREEPPSDWSISSAPTPKCFSIEIVLRLKLLLSLIPIDHIILI